MYFILKYSGENGFEKRYVSVTDIDNLRLLASEVLRSPSTDISLFLFVDGTQIDDNDYLESLESWTKLFIYEPNQREKLLIYFNIKRYFETKWL